MKLVKIAQFAIAGLILAAGAAPLNAADDFKREGEGARRATLDAMELKPFKAEAWSKLTDWTNGGAISPADTSGKVVVICTWADYYPPGKRALTQALKLAEKHSAADLVVVAAYNSSLPTGWKDAQKPAQPKDACFRIANDASGDFRKSLHADQDPNFYVIDRAGQMRFADLDKASLEPAVDMLLKEKTDDASGINSQLAKDAAARDAEARRTAAINTGASMVELPELPFTPPTPDAYKEAKWPKMPKLNDYEPAPEPGQAAPPPIGFRIPDSGWIGPKPVSTGRAALVYFWHPEARVSYAAMDVFSKMDLIKTQRSRDLVVAGIVTKLYDQGSDQTKLELDPKKLKERVEKFIAGRDLKQSIYLDPAGALFDISRRGKSYPIPAPWVAIISSDGIMRWSGPMGLPSFEAALEQVLRVDPGVQARRAVEAEYLRAQGK
jgi:hypothetical protein